MSHLGSFGVNRFTNCEAAKQVTVPMVFRKRLLIVTLVLQLLLQVSFVTSVSAQSADTSASNAVPANLDLASTDRTIAASSNSGFSSAVIQVGQTSRTITGSDLLTPAENIALQQVLSSGQQSLILGDLGAAIGGSFNLSAGIATGGLTGLVIPTGVAAIHDFGMMSNLNLTGNFTNSGTFYAISSNSAVTSANISALNIMNQAGALLSSVLPAGGFTGYGALVSNLSLNLTAINDIVNSGSIISSGNLSAIAGGAITNSSVVGQNMAVMQAANNLNLQAMNITNSGLLAAQLGNINIATQQLTNSSILQSLAGNINILNSLNPANGLVVNQTNSAVMEALNGAISFNVIDPLLKVSMNISGGSLLAQELNFNNGDGSLNVALKDVAGTVNINSGTANFGVSDGTHGLNIQSFNITGDPNLTYSGAGAFSSGAFNSFGGYVDIDNSADTTGGSITFTGDINTTPLAAGSGGSVRLNAGTTITTQNIITSANISGRSGEIILKARGNINIASITANGLGAGNTSANMCASDATRGSRLETRMVR